MKRRTVGKNDKGNRRKKKEKGKKKREEKLTPEAPH